MKPYDQEIYRQLFARLLARAMQQGKHDPVLALQWLERKYKLALAMLFSQHKMELADAYMDVRQHLQARLEDGEGR
jgi:hypothetical protein